MRIHAVPCLLLVVIGCGSGQLAVENKDIIPDEKVNSVTITDEKSWAYFLQHLPVVDSPVLDYRGRPVPDQNKAVGIIPFDVGTADLQQCADALMRLRAEYLFKQGKHDEIGFHFVSGQYYSWNDYCKGLRPVPSGQGVKMVNRNPVNKDHQNLRKYLDIVYTYASTISLAKELKPASEFGIGTIVIHPGSPGHCFIIIDEKTDEKNIHYFRLAEGYTPAQSIYELRNEEEEGKSPWHRLTKGARIETASYLFSNYLIKKFE